MIVEYDTDLDRPVGYLTVQEMAEKWKISPNTLRQQVFRNRVRTIRVGGRVYIPEDEKKIDFRKFYSGRKPEEDLEDWDDDVGFRGFKIKRNAIRCKNCGDVIESMYTHDFKWCSCGQCAVDGGLSYMKRCYKTDTAEEAYDDISEWEEMPVE